MLKEKMASVMGTVVDQETFVRETGVSRGTMAKICCYRDLLEQWQKKINLVSNNSLAAIWSRHFYDSFQLKSLLDQSTEENLQILDIGSGAGFPGLLLSILGSGPESRPESGPKCGPGSGPKCGPGSGKFHLVESNGKKCAFMNHVIRETGCNAVVHCARVEELKTFHVDYIISRACATVGKLIELGHNFIHPDTVCLFLKGRNIDEEIAAARQKWQFRLEKFTSISESAGIVAKVSDIKLLNEDTQAKGSEYVHKVIHRR